VVDQVDQKTKERWRVGEREVKNEDCVAHRSKRTNKERERKRKEYTKNDYTYVGSLVDIRW
jgi:hypothetical protein